MTEDAMQPIVSRADASDGVPPEGSVSRPARAAAPAQPMPQTMTERFLALSTAAKLGFGLLILGMAALAVPTLVFVGRESWSTEQGAHGPIVLFTGIWLLVRMWKTAGQFAPPPLWRGLVLVAAALILFILARISGIIELEGYLMYASLLAGMYTLTGGRFMAKLAFPLIYMAFIFPPPETVVYTITLPMKIAITEASVGLLKMFGYPIGHSGVWIQVGQYQLLMAAACSGLNSIVSLTVLGSFYVFIRHQAKGLRSILLLLLIVPVAVAANFVRVLILILLTYHGGEALAQGFMHNFAGMTMFAAALLLLYGADILIGRFLKDPDDQPRHAAFFPQAPAPAE